MVCYLKKLIHNFRFNAVLCIAALLPVESSIAQDSPVWDKSALKDSVGMLLGNYQTLVNKLNNQSDPSVERGLVNLFTNPKVQVVNDFRGQTKIAKISLDEYIVKISELFPEGLSVSLDLSRLMVEKPAYDRNNRYIILIKVNRSVKGISEGKVLSINQKVIFRVAFIYTGNSASGFSIYGMDLPQTGDGLVSVSFSPGFTGFLNSAIQSDGRLGMKKAFGFSSGAAFTWYFSEHVGIGAGGQYSRYSGLLTLDKFDAFGGFDPNFRDVKVENELWFMEMPVFLSLRTNPAKRLQLLADAGLYGGWRIFETMSSSAVNTNTGITLTNVISDADWIGQLNRFNLGVRCSASLHYRIGFAGVFIGCGYRQGLTGLDINPRSDFSKTRYQGQYNPLWAAPGETASQAFFAMIGFTCRINRGGAK